MLAHLLDVSLRALPLAIAAAAVLRIPRLRSAAWAHAAWSMVLFGMLLLFVLGPALKPILLRVLAPAPAAQESLWSRSPTCLGACEPVDGRVANPRQVGDLPHKPAPVSVSASEIASGVYLLIAAALLARLFVGAWLARRLLAGSVRTGVDFYESSRIAVPLTIGWLRPVILLPSAWRNWDRSKIEAVLLHERSHIRRRDSLIALLATINRCLFWFHPLAWWIEHKLAFLAEQACDEACVCELEDRREYARLLLEMAGAVEASGGRISGHALAMARPSQIHRRIDAILDHTRAAHRGLTALGWTAVLLCGLPIIYAAGSMRIEPKFSLPRPSVPWFVLEAPVVAQSRPEPILIAQVPAPPPTPQPVAAPSQIVLPVVVTEPAGRYVTGLQAENFQIVEGPNIRPITSFELAEGKHAIALLNTTGASRDALDAFPKILDPRDESFILDGPPAANIEPFLDAIYAAVVEVKQKQNPVKAVVVIMQGGINNPLAPESSVARILRVALRSPRVTISFVTEPTTVGATYTQQDDLRILMGATGGQLMPVARAEELATALTKIGLGLRQQYLLGFVASDLPPGALARPSIEMVRTAGLPDLRAIGPGAYIQ